MTGPLEGKSNIPKNPAEPLAGQLQRRPSVGSVAASLHVRLPGSMLGGEVR